MATLQKERQEILNKWLSNPSLDKELKEELNNLNEEDLFDAFYCDLEFGTGGMRGVIGAGTNRMNIYTLRSANYGFGKYLLGNSSHPTCAIAYDSRRKSLDFAKESAVVLANMGIKVYLFDKITPTPELSFAVRYLKATGGIVVTASHNPAKYNGYKIYDETGCQLVPGKAEIVIKNISFAPDALSMKLTSYDELVKKGLIEIVGEKIDNEYLKCVKSVALHLDQKKDNFKVVFTSLHGTSAYLGQKLLKEVGYNFIPVAEQMIPDSEFRTVPLPNPEDKNAFTLAIKYAKENDADICIATDPDADRVGLAVRSDDDYVLLNGNQTGALLINYLCHEKKIEKKGVVFNTIVTSPLGAVIAKSFGMDTFSTLTGFKYIGEQATILENDKEREFFFGYEESYGYVVKDFVRDKDSLQALLLCSEMACFYKNKGKNLLEVLDDIYKKYDYYEEDLVNISLTGASGAEKIKRILNYFRYQELNNELLKVVVKEDYELRKAKNYQTKDEWALTLPKSNVVKYFLDDDSFFVLRPSGTEPKMKVYISVHRKTKDDAVNRNQEIKKAVLDIVSSVE